MNWYNRSKSEKINLTKNEFDIFDLIKKARDSYLPGLSLRIAGGWVRDRILGKVSDDIDIAVSGGDGISVAKAVRNYDLSNNGGKRTGDPYAVSLEKSSTPGDKDSSSLMVGALSIDGVKVEFVPMRSEKYSSESRIPKIVSSDDPKEDVKRRDLTINALYYNIDTGMVEDYVGGVDDLKNGIIRTPGDPNAILSEDPLRALRALRFMSQMRGFKLDDSLLDALGSDELKKAYVKKVAPERARKEIEKIVTGKNPADAIRILFSTNLYIPVFGHPSLVNFKNISMDQGNPHHAYNLLEHTVHVVKNLNDMLIDAGASDKERMVAILAAIFHDFGKMDPGIAVPSKNDPSKTSYPGHEDISANMVEEILKRMGFGNERFLVQKVVQLHMRPHGEMATPKSIGKFLREFDSISFPDDLKEKLWRLTFLHSIADSMSKGAVDYHEDVKGKHDQISTIEKHIEDQAKIGKKPLLDGNEIRKIFPDLNPKTGFIKLMQNALLEAQDDGRVKDKVTAERFLKENAEDIIKNKQ